MFPGAKRFTVELHELVSAAPPPFIFVNDPVSPQITSANVVSVLASIPSAQHVLANGVACFIAKLFFDTVIQGFTDLLSPQFEDDEPHKSIPNFDAFLHSLRTVHSQLTTGNIKGKQKAYDAPQTMVIVIERAERLKDRLPELIVPLTRLRELSQLELSVIFISQVRWEDIRPSLGSADPYFVDVSTPSKQDIVQWLVADFNSSTETNDTYHPALRPLYSHFASIVCDACYPFSNDPYEIAYVAAARWPGFSKPVIDSSPPNDVTPPSEETRLRLTRYFMPSIKAALNQLYPRLTNAFLWGIQNEPEHHMFSKPHSEIQPVKVADISDAGSSLEGLPRMSKFILVASFLASMNPAKSDARMFGRGLDEKKRKRRVVARSKSSSKVTVPIHFVGPSPFPLDRMIAILGVLLEENDAGKRPDDPRYTIPGEQTDVEITRVGVYSSIMELARFRLLYRTSPSDKLDGPPMFKCGIGYHEALALAKPLDIKLNDLLWDPK
ncbi:origin recognition complex subunit 5 C-terminus-domain-containing protein [Mycena floridula]|nr:origin recognition complex subunit 5 C-terminus-domain-containing protein [Mycena floridula]